MGIPKSTIYIILIVMRISVVLILCVEQETRVHEGAGVNWEAISDIDSTKRREKEKLKKVKSFSLWQQLPLQLSQPSTACCLTIRRQNDFGWQVELLRL